MCEPTTLAALMAASSVGSALVGYQGARNQAAVQNHLARQNEALALTALQEDYQALQTRQIQEMDAASQDIQARRLEELKQMATSTVASGEAGVSGFSVDRVLRDIGATASRDISTIEQNRDWSLQQLSHQMRGARSQAISRMASVQRATKPSLLPFALQATQGVGNAYMHYRSTNVKK